MERWGCADKESFGRDDLIWFGMAAMQRLLEADQRSDEGNEFGSKCLTRWGDGQSR